VDIDKLREIVGESAVITDRSHTIPTCWMNVAAVRPKPAENVVVVKPANTMQISEIRAGEPR